MATIAPPPPGSDAYGAMSHILLGLIYMIKQVLLIYTQLQIVPIHMMYLLFCVCVQFKCY